MSAPTPAAAGAPPAGAADGSEAKSKAARRSGKQKACGRGGGGDVAEARPEDFVLIQPYKRRAAPKEGWAPVGLSRADRAAQLAVSDDRRAVTGAKGYRSVRATHGAHEGTWYCEVTVTHLGETGACRLGWATAKADLQAPVGFDTHGYAYRSLEGAKVHKAWRAAYAAPYGEGDVIGMLLHMPPGGKAKEPRDEQVVRLKGLLYTVVDNEEPRPLPGSGVAFTRNGALQGVAFADILEGTYYPAASLYTRHRQAEGATVTFNFGPDFQHPPPDVEGWPPARPASELAGEPPGPPVCVPAGGGGAAPAAPAAEAEAAAAAAEAGAAAAAGPGAGSGATDGGQQGAAEAPAAAAAAAAAAGGASGAA